MESGLLEYIASAAFVFFLGAHFLGIFTLGILKYRLRKTVCPGYLPGRRKATRVSEELED